MHLFFVSHDILLELHAASVPCVYQVLAARQGISGFLFAPATNVFHSATTFLGELEDASVRLGPYGQPRALRATAGPSRRYAFENRARKACT